MIPVHFGQRDRPLFGVYDPAPPPRKRSAVLILNPGGWELIRAHRSLRTLAQQLQRAGMDVMRFDYRGTGDSWGDADDVDSLRDWTEDVDEAIEELMDLAGVDRVSLVGLRLGASLAALTARRRPQEVERLVLWEPLPRTDAAPAGGPPVDVPAEDRPALAVPDAVLAGLVDLDIALPDRIGLHVLVATSGNNPDPASSMFGGPVDHISVPTSPECWIEDSDFGAGAVPMELIDGIVSWFG